jgi:hypothetical protein
VATILRLNSFPIEQTRNIQQLEERLGSWFASRNFPVRLLAYSHAFNMTPAIQRVRRDMESLVTLAQAADPLLSATDALLAQAGGANGHRPPWEVFGSLPDQQQQLLRDVFANQATVLETALAKQERGSWATIADALATVLWPLPWMKEMIRFYEHLTLRHIRSVTYVLIAWHPSEISGEGLGNTLRLATGRDVQVIEQVPNALKGNYVEMSGKLRPEQPGNPWLQVLTAYDMRGNWHATTLHQILDVPFDVAISVDIHTVPRNSASRSAEFAYNAARLAMAGKQKDPQAERKYVDAEYVMHALMQQSLHDVNLAILVSGDTEQDLRNNAAMIQSQMGMSLKLTTVHGVQGELIKLWSTARKREIQAPLSTRNMLSNGIGCLAGVLGYHRVSRTDGPLWGIDGMRRAPIFFDVFSGNAAGHMLILGKTGFGKTWFLNQMTMRGAAIQGWKIIGVDAFRNGERIETAAGAGARCNWIGPESAINIFDIVVDTSDATWVNSQAAIVLNQLGLLLGRPGRGPDGKEQLIQRDFSVQERGFLSRAILSLYESVPPDASLSAMPIISNLIAKLETYREDGAKLLAKDLRIFCFGTEDVEETRLTAEGGMFNRHSTVDWGFSKDINYYDFSKVPDLYRPFYYSMAIGAINRYMRDPRRDVKRRTLLMIDEFGYVTQVQAVAQMAADICKVARKYGIALVVIDQNPTTFLDNAAGVAIWENTRVKMMFHLDDKPARLVGEAISDLTPAHVDYLSRAQKGECVTVIDNDVFVMVVETNPRETRAFSGS